MAADASLRLKIRLQRDIGRCASGRRGNMTEATCVVTGGRDPAKVQEG
jgi:hypothetical protein